MFQFQHGAIGRFPYANLPPSAAKVSIPAWCDWEKPTQQISRVRRVVSIPAWCDWEKPLLCWALTITKVSIPAWCDWEYPPIVSEMRTK